MQHETGAFGRKNGRITKTIIKKDYDVLTKSSKKLQSENEKLTEGANATAKKIEKQQLEIKLLKKYRNFNGAREESSGDDESTIYESSVSEDSCAPKRTLKKTYENTPKKSYKRSYERTYKKSHENAQKIPKKRPSESGERRGKRIHSNSNFVRVKKEKFYQSDDESCPPYNKKTKYLKRKRSVSESESEEYVSRYR
jgi:hypothetical protein